MPDTLEDDPEFEPHPPPCERCGREHYRSGRRTCTAHKKSGMPCMSYPIHDHHVCRTHGGSAPQTRDAAEWNRRNREAREMAAAALSTYGMTPPDPTSIDPVADLLVEVWRSGRAERFWAERVAELKVPDPAGDGLSVHIVGHGDDAVPMEVLGDAGSILGPNRFGELVTHPWVLMWNAERDRHALLCRKAIEAGIEERMVNLAEEQGAIVAEMFRAVLGELIRLWELTPRHLEQALEVAGRELRAIG